MPAARVVALAQVGLVDDAGPPVASAVVVPAMCGHDAVEITTELLQRHSIVDRLTDRRGKVGHQLVTVGAGDHETLIML